MKTANTILLELLPGQSSLDALAERLLQPKTVLRAFLTDLETDGLVQQSTIKSTLTIYRLTDDGISVASALNLQPA